MELEEILGGSIATFIVVLFGLIVLPLAERFTGESMLILTVPLALIAAVGFFQSLRDLGRGRGDDARILRIQATRAGTIFIAATFWSVILVLTFRYTVLDLYDSLSLDGKFLLWFGITCFVILRIYLSVLTRTVREERGGSEGALEQKIIQKSPARRQV